MMAGFGYIVAVLIIGTVTSQSTVYVHEIYAKKTNTNRSVACGVCEAREGYLARDPVLDDWEILFGNWSHLETMDFWVDLIKTDSGDWFWGDSTPLDMNQIGSLPMTPAYNQTYTAWKCALWNMAEPFLMPADCALSANILCQVPTTEPECQYSELVGMKFNETAVQGLETSSRADYDACKSWCSWTDNCWAVDWKSTTRQCRRLTGTSTRPTVPHLIPDSNCKVVGRTCVKYQEMSERDSDFVCNCDAIELPQTEEEKEQFVEEYKEEVKRELIVPTETLSATVRKKESAPDERKSSTGIGYLGVTMMVVVFGGLILMDLTSLFAHAKMAASNVKGVFVNGQEASTDA